MSVVSDTSPLIALAQLDLLHLLPELFGKITIPDAVALEFLAGPDQVGRTLLLEESWIVRRSVMDKAFLGSIAEHLDSGESEAIVVAVECNARLLLIDDNLGRKQATQLGVTMIGTAGILQLAKAAGLIERVAPLLQRLRDELRFRLSNDAVAVILQAVGEA